MRKFLPNIGLNCLFFQAEIVFNQKKKITSSAWTSHNRARAFPLCFMHNSHFFVQNVEKICTQKTRYIKIIILPSSRAFLKETDEILAANEWQWWTVTTITIWCHCFDLCEDQQYYSLLFFPPSVPMSTYRKRHRMFIMKKALALQATPSLQRCMNHNLRTADLDNSHRRIG